MVIFHSKLLNYQMVLRGFLHGSRPEPVAVSGSCAPSSAGSCSMSGNLWKLLNVGIAIINHPPYHHKWVV